MAGLLAIMLSSGCYRMSAERLRCLNHCAQEKDRCILAARNTWAIQRCDSETNRCVRSCPR